MSHLLHLPQYQVCRQHAGRFDVGYLLAGTRPRLQREQLAASICPAFFSLARIHQVILAEMNSDDVTR